MLVMPTGLFRDNQRVFNFRNHDSPKGFISMPPPPPFANIVRVVDGFDEANNLLEDM